MTKLTSFFGLDPETATESEIDAALQGVESIAQIKADAQAEAQAAIESRFSEIADRLAKTESDITALNAEKAAFESEIESAKANAETLKAEIEQKEKANADLSAKITQLAGEVSALKAGKPIDKSEGEGGEQFEVKTKNGVLVVSANSLDEHYGFKK